jgi:hypothetical protein
MLQIEFDHVTCGKIDLSGSITKKSTLSAKIDNHYNQAFHLDKIGTLVEDMETNVRNILDEIYIKKTQEVKQ